MAAAEQSSIDMIEPAPFASQLSPDVKFVTCADGIAGGCGGGGGGGGGDGTSPGQEHPVQSQPS